MFAKQLVAGWGDMDFNSHMRNTAYLDKSADVRMMFFADSGFPMQEFSRLKIGPVVKTDTIEYFKEIKLLEEFKVELSVKGLAEDGSRFIFQNEFFRLDGKLAARVVSHGGWLNHLERKLTLPPEALLNVIRELSKTDDFQVLPSSIT